MEGLELVVWRDAHFKMDEPEYWPEDYLVYTAGYVIEEELFLRIESERTPDGPRAITRVPLEMVVSRLPLAPFHKMSSTL